MIKYKHLLLLVFFFCNYSYLQAEKVIYANTRTDFRDETIYFLITTRFYDGDTTNNVQCWDGQQYNEGDPPWRGDFKGLIQKLDYIKALGFTAIWITPIVENCSGYDYHGYHALNFKKVDPRYESTDTTFKDLIDAAHQKGLKIILDIVLNHTGNFGESKLCPMFKKNYNKDLSNSKECLIRDNESLLPTNYDQLTGEQKYQARLSLLKNSDHKNHDKNNYWHHFGNFNWDNLTSQWAQIAGDCVDLNTENPLVYNYLIKAYSQYIRLGVDAFRIDTGKHISRLVFNKVFNDAFYKVGQEMGKKFFMFAEICTRDRNYWYRNTPALSSPFYTWKESKFYNWSEDSSEYIDQPIWAESTFTATNQLSCIAMYNDNMQETENSQPTSTNAFLLNNTYHQPDYSKSSGLHVIDFPMHWNFEDAGSAFNIAKAGDHAYNDATFNVMYVDSHDYSPDGAPESQRYSKGQDVWAENLDLMFTFRGIPCIYYGSEIEFKKGKIIDKGPNMPLRESGRAYFGNYLTGDLSINNDGTIKEASGNIAVTLQHPLAQHLIRLNQIRKAVPALRKGQYTTEGVSGSLAFKRRYTDANIDSYACITISGNAHFTSIPNGKYIDCITGNTQTVTDGRLQITCTGKGNLRIYVLDSPITPAPGKIGEDGKYLYNKESKILEQENYPEDPEALTEIPEESEPPVITPVLLENEQAVFFKKPTSWGKKINAYIYYKTDDSTIKVTQNWPGDQAVYLGNNNYKFTIEKTKGIINQPTTWYLLFNDLIGHQTVGDPGFLIKNGGFYSKDGYSYSIATTAIEKLFTTMQTVIHYHNNKIHLFSPIAKSAQIYNTRGKLIKTINLERGENQILFLVSGWYIIDKQIFLVR